MGCLNDILMVYYVYLPKESRITILKERSDDMLLDMYVILLLRIRVFVDMMGRRLHFGIKIMMD